MEIAERQVRTHLDGAQRLRERSGFDRPPLDQRSASPNNPMRRVLEAPAMVNGVLTLSEDPARSCRLLQGLMRPSLQPLPDNVGYRGRREITPEQNDRLGAILRAVPA